MAVNLVHQFGREKSRELLEQSFAQFQADRAVVGLARQLQQGPGGAGGLCRGGRPATSATSWSTPHCAVASPRSRRARPGSGAPIGATQAMESLDQAQAGRRDHGAERQVRRLRGHHRSGRRRRDEPRPYVLTADRQARRLSLDGLLDPGRGRSPGCGSRSRSTPATRHAAPRPGLGPADQDPRPDAAAPAASPAATRSSSRRSTARSRSCARRSEQHPCHQCPDREDHARWAERSSSSTRDTETLKRRVESRTNTVARTFDRVCERADRAGLPRRGQGHDRAAAA